MCVQVLMTAACWRYFTQQYLIYLTILVHLVFSLLFCCFLLFFFFRSQPCKRGLLLHILVPLTSVCMRMRIWTQRSAPNQKQNWITPAGTQKEMSIISILILIVWFSDLAAVQFCIFLSALERHHCAFHVGKTKKNS